MGEHAIAHDKTIEQVLSDQPAVLPVFLAHRLACVGCYMTRFCTLEDAITTYGLPRDRFLAELRRGTAMAREPGHSDAPR